MLLPISSRVLSLPLSLTASRTLSSALMPWRRPKQKYRQMPGYDLHLEHASAWGAAAGCESASTSFHTLSLGAQGVRAATVRVRQPLRVRCTAGTVWLTCDGDARDFVLDAGADYAARPGEVLVLLGMPMAVVAISNID